MRREQVSIGRKTISYLASGGGGAEALTRRARHVLFLHAFPLQAAMWQPTLDALPKGWRGIAPDCRGMGESSFPTGEAEHRMTDYAGDAVDLLDRLEIPDAVVVGCSMGGYVLFEMLRAAPGMLMALGLVSTRPGSDSEEGRRNREHMIAQVAQEGLDAIANQMVPKLIGATTQRERPEIAKQVRDLIVANARQGVSTAVSAMMHRADSTSLLQRIAVPTLIVAGAEDALIPSAEADAMHNAIPASRYELMPFVGHLPNLEDPAHFNAILSEFLNTL